MSNVQFGPIVTPLNEVEIETDAWLWPGRAPLGAITTLVGYGGEGKSFLACSIASIISRGGVFPDGAPAPLGSVIVMAGEDLPSKLRLRYEANGADLAHIKLLEGQRIYTKGGVAETNITLRDIDLIRAAVEQTAGPPVKLLIIDPIGDFIPGVNSDKDNEVRALLNPLAHLAKERELAVLLICHRKKAAGDRADHAALGSVAFTAKARAVHHVVLDPYDAAHPSERRRLFLPGKLNDQQQAVGLAFQIRAPEGVVEWEAAPVTQSADAVMQYAAAKARANRSANPDSLTDAMAWLSEALKEGPRAARDLASDARAEGIAAYTLRRARERLGVHHSRLGTRGSRAISIWELPRAKEGEASPEDSQEGDLAGSRETESAREGAGESKARLGRRGGTDRARVRGAHVQEDWENPFPPRRRAVEDSREGYE